VVVSHDAVNRQVLAAFRPELGEPDTLPQDNGCFNTLKWRDGTWVVLDVNEIPPGCEGQPDRPAAARQTPPPPALKSPVLLAGNRLAEFLLVHLRAPPNV
jgi:broad specificity phosphatase PhoE